MSKLPFTSAEQNKYKIIIPAYEPDERLLTFIKELKNTLSSEVIIIDDGSGPEYEYIFKTLSNDYDCIVLKHYVNMGKGRALKDAFNYCLNTYPDMTGCVTADSDGQHTPFDIFKCMQELYNNPDRLILGCRDFSTDGVPNKSKYGNRITTFVVKLFCGMKISDTQTGLRAIPRAFMSKVLTTPGERFEYEMNMLIDCKYECPIKEVSIETIYESKDNHRTHFDPIRDSYRIYKIFGKMFLHYTISSLSSCVVDLLFFSMFCSAFKSLIPIYYVTIATVLARIISASYNYLINYKLVFHSNDGYVKTGTKYFTLALVQMTLSAFLVTVLNILIPVIPETGIKVVVDVCLFFISYYVQREFIFKKIK
ncbi:MAG: bifunctional glycosyltransferase family 2/GtrA family protein [Butyrivibrio sp.]|uniref:bifunctional glycosyltransferase family 2/GtrA family protein n=1 Tax=Butyrivibrio sp. TaxID=28121 RepID=UPI0025DC3A57|nr:bifunctional glycosyltransferase family 2/GtrA family protein [Butyrivibrio sp.]MCR5769959.1 bifunctional glycosyltransferase family 2/GtrA family protein [Butyrivibrio sp.]